MVINIYIYIYILKNRKKTTLLSLSTSLFVIAHSPGDFNDKNSNIHDRRSYGHKIYIINDDGMFNCYVATLCSCGGKKIQVHYFC